MNRPPSHRPRKRFGQHFLIDTAIIDSIVAAATAQSSGTFVEIGPGQGALTIPLLRVLDTLHVIELDRDLVPALGTLPGAADRLTIHNVDVLKFDFNTLEPGIPLHIVGNLPYNISTPLIFHLLQYRERVHSMVFMLQSEVVQRLTARPGNKSYGKLSVMAQYHCACEWLLDVPPAAFNPPPKVESAVVRLTPHDTPPVDVGGEKQFAAVLQHAFSQRRKTLRNTLQPLFSSDDIEACGVRPDARAETLDIQQFAALSRRLCAR